jgi:hypothetical protein
MAKRLASLVGLLSILLGTPVLLWQAAGAPGLHGLPNLQGIRRAIDLRWVPLEWAITILALLAWALWAYLAVAVLIRLAGHAERRIRSAGRIWAASEAFAWGPVKLAVDLTVGAALITSSLGHSSTRATSSDHMGWSAVIAPQVAALRAEIGSSSPSNGSVNAMRRESQERASTESQKPLPRGTDRSYVVRPGDSLWSIAEAKLGDPYRWTEIWKLNRGRRVGHEERLERPGFIRPGWRLHLPETRHDAKTRDDRHQERCETETVELADTDVSPGEHGASPSPAEAAPINEPRHDERLNLPSGSAVTVGFVAGFLSALGLSELLRRRKREPRQPSPGWPRARPRRDLKARLMRALNTMGAAAPPPDDPAELARKVQSSSKEIVLGHRDGKTIVASRRGCLFSFTGKTQTVLGYLRDLALHAALSHKGLVEVWTTSDLGLSKFPALRTFDNPRGLVSELEIEILKRHRMFDEEGTQAWETHQEAWPDDPLALVLGIAPVNDPSLRNRFQAVATQGQDLGIIVLSVMDEQATLRVEDRLIRPLEPELETRRSE